MSRPHKKNGIPDRWLDYQAVGKRLPGTRFIAFKVPLKWALNNNLSRCDVFGHWELLDALKKEGQELGLIIDLTFTTRYYKAEDMPESLQYVKIFTAGHEVPSDATILSFKRAVHRFLGENTENDKLIGVHCTHGLNRTGYLICRYLIDVDAVEPQEAIRLFDSARGHSIERQNYLEDLKSGAKRSNEGIEVSEQEPVRGTSNRRPVYSEANISHTEERPSVSQESSYNRRKKHHPSHGGHSHERPSHERPSHERPRHERPSHERPSHGRPRHGGPSHGGPSPFVGPSPGGSGLLPPPGGPALLPFPGGPGFLPLPAFAPPPRPPFRPYRWAGASNAQWHAPPPHSRGPEHSHSPHAFASAPGPSQWTNGSGTYGSEGSKRWSSPKMRPPHRQQHRVNHYDYPA